MPYTISSLRTLSAQKILSVRFSADSKWIQFNHDNNLAEVYTLQDNKNTSCIACWWLLPASSIPINERYPLTPSYLTHRTRRYPHIAQLHAVVWDEPTSLEYNSGRSAAYDVVDGYRAGVSSCVLGNNIATLIRLSCISKLWDSKLVLPIIPSLSWHHHYGQRAGLLACSSAFRQYLLCARWAKHKLRKVGRASYRMHVKCLRQRHIGIVSFQKASSSSYYWLSYWRHPLRSS